MYVMILYAIIGGHLTYVNESAPFDDLQTCQNAAMVTSESVGTVTKCVRK